MGFLINIATVSIVLLSCMKLVAADTYYIGPTVGGIIGLVSCENRCV